MELKGRMVETMSAQKKSKAKQTLKRMEKTRKEDDKYVRDKTDEKIAFCEKERDKGLAMIKQYENSIANLRIQVDKLDGAITALKEIKNMPNEPKTGDK